MKLSLFVTFYPKENVILLNYRHYECPLGSNALTEAIRTAHFSGKAAAVHRKFTSAKRNESKWAYMRRAIYGIVKLAEE